MKQNKVRDGSPLLGDPAFHKKQKVCDQEIHQPDNWLEEQDNQLMNEHNSPVHLPVQNWERALREKIQAVKEKDIMRDECELLKQKLLKYKERSRKLKHALDEKQLNQSSGTAPKIPLGVMEIFDSFQFSKAFQKACTNESSIIFLLKKAKTRFAFSSNDFTNFCMSITFESTEFTEEDDEDDDEDDDDLSETIGRETDRYKPAPFKLRVRYQCGSELDIIERGDSDIRYVYVGSTYKESKHVLTKAASKFHITKDAMMIIIAHSLYLLPKACRQRLLSVYPKHNTVIGTAMVLAGMNQTGGGGEQ